jgi:outer membrane receptor protein involved in Fe transport
MTDNPPMARSGRTRAASPARVTSPARAAWLAAAAALAGSVAAADAAASGPGVTAEAGDTLGEIVVTAARRTQARLDVAASLTRVEPGPFGRLETGHAEESLNRVAGVLIQRGSGQESLTAIRSPVLTGPGACGAFLLLEDGFPVRPAGFCNVNQLFELNTAQAAAIEVLRGPGTAVHGAHAVHGVVNVVTPSAADLAGAAVGIGAGTYGQRSFSFSGGVDDHGGGDGAAASAIYGQWRHDGGFRADSPVSEGKINALHDREVAGGALRLRIAATALDQETAGFIRGLDAYKDPALRASNPNPEAFRDARSARLSAAWLAEPCAGCERELRLALRQSRMTFLQHFLPGKPLERNAQQSAALGASAGGPVRWLPGLAWRAGADLEWADSSLLEVQDGPTLEGSAAARAIRPAGRHYDYAVRGLTGAAWASLDWRSAGGRWRIAGALRGERTRYDYDNRMIDGNTAEDGTPCPGGCLYSRPADRSDGFTNLSPKIELAFAASATDRLYVSAGRGFRPPEMTELYRLQRQQRSAELGSERMSALEAGWKHAGNRLGASIAAFAMRKDGVILRESNGFNVGDGRTTHEGLEYELSVKLPGRLTASASGSVTRHRYDFDRVVEGGETIVRGLDVDTAPRQLHALQFDWRPVDELSATLGLRRVGRYFVDASNQRAYPGHTSLDLRVAWRLGPRLRATLQVDNLADRAYADRADFAQGDWRYFPARGRAAFLGIDYSDRT